MSGITLHPKYGVNPTLGVCFYCGQESGEIAMLGYNDGKKAEMHSIISKEPCDFCKENMTKGIIFVEAKEIGGEPRPCGGYIVLKEEALENFLVDPMLSQVREKRMCFIDTETWDQLGFPRGDVGED